MTWKSWEWKWGRNPPKKIRPMKWRPDQREMEEKKMKKLRGKPKRSQKNVEQRCKDRADSLDGIWERKRRKTKRGEKFWAHDQREGFDWIRAGTKGKAGSRTLKEICRGGKKNGNKKRTESFSLWRTLETPPKAKRGEQEKKRPAAVTKTTRNVGKLRGGPKAREG